MSDFSIFGDLDVQAAADDPFAVSDGTYGATVTECSAGPTNKGDKKGMTFIFTIDESDDSAMIGRKYSEWLEIPVPADPKNLTPEEAQKASRLKSRLLSLGTPKDQINSAKTSDFLGIGVVIRIATTEKNGREYQNIKDLKVRDGAVASATPAATVNPFLGITSN